MKISAWPKDERPREKLFKNGASQLTDAELLAIIFRIGSKGQSAVELAMQMLQSHGGLRALMDAEASTVMSQIGFGPVKYVQLQACLEITKRYFSESLPDKLLLDSSASVKQHLIHQLRSYQHEVFAVLWLDVKHKLICFEILFEGTINSTSVYPRILLKQALKHNAGGVILVHNHPSGDPSPSISDKRMTRVVVDVLSAIDVAVIDHIIVGDGVTFSFAEHGIMDR